MATYLKSNWYNFAERRTWFDWAALVLGIIAVASPWLFGEVVGWNIIVNAVVVGVVIGLMAILQMVAVNRWQEVISLVAGVWLVISPFVFEYAGSLATAHFVLGALVAILAAVELWFHPEKTEKATT